MVGTIKEDFEKTFGKKKWKELQVVYHSIEEPPKSEEGKVIFRLLEMLDYECFKFGDNQGIDEKKAKTFLIRHKEEMKNMKDLKPTSYIGLMAGVFNFLK